MTPTPADGVPTERQDQSTLPQVAIGDLPDDAVILDVRDHEEWDRGHAPGAIHIPVDELADRLEELPQATGPLPVTCRGGGRAGRAVAYLRGRGLDVANLTEGMLGWQAAGRPLSGGGGAPEVR